MTLFHIRTNLHWRRTIGLGLCSGHTSLNAFPGWKSSSWGYHGDNGKAYAESDTGTPYGETFGAGDVIGCLIISGDGVVFTKNGASLGKDPKVYSLYAKLTRL
jgi:hypothetical protein